MNMDNQIVEVNLDDIIPNRFQPRLAFDEKGLKELAASIKEHGIIQPLVLRKIGDKYEIIAGERRYKASTMAGLTKVPAVIANIDDNKSAEVALVENIQRRDLTPIEEAKSYKTLLDKGYLTQEQLAKKMGLSQSAISNKLRLLNLDEEVQEALLAEKISERHARALLVLDTKEEQKEWLHRIINERLTVRQLDLELKKLKEENATESGIPLVNLTPNIDDIMTKATDINPVTSPKNLEDMLKPDPSEASITNYMTEEFAPPAEPVAPTAVKEEPKGRFFNFLEDEPATLVTEEAPTIFTAPVVEPEKIPEEPSVEKLDVKLPDIEVLELPSLALSPLESPKPEAAPPLPTIEELAPSPSKYLDPVSMIDQFSPERKQEEQIAAQYDLKSAIDIMRDTIKALEALGFRVDNEEIDFDTYYSFNIKINKN